MIQMPYYDLTTISDPEEIKSIMREATSVMKQNALMLNFHKDEVRDAYAEQVKNIQNYLTVLEIMLENG